MSVDGLNASVVDSIGKQIKDSNDQMIQSVLDTNKKIDTLLDKMSSLTRALRLHCHSNSKTMRATGKAW